MEIALVYTKRNKKEWKTTKGDYSFSPIHVFPLPVPQVFETGSKPVFFSFNVSLLDIRRPLIWIESRIKFFFEC